MHHLYWIIPVVVLVALSLVYWFTRDRRGLSECIFWNDIEAVKKHLAAHPEWVNDPLPDDDEFLRNCPPIFSVQSIEMFDLFLELGADTKQLGRFGYLDDPDPEIIGALAAVCSCCHNTLPIVQKLVAMGADVNERSSHGHTPLMCCASNGRLEPARFLLEHHADPNLLTSEGHTALLWAVQYNRVEIVQLLVNYGADPELSTPSAMDTAFIALARFPGSPTTRKTLEALQSKGSNQRGL